MKIKQALLDLNFQQPLLLQLALNQQSFLILFVEPQIIFLGTTLLVPFEHHWQFYQH